MHKSVNVRVYAQECECESTWARVQMLECICESMNMKVDV